jgi:hypothetical protein
VTEETRSAEAAIGAARMVRLKMIGEKETAEKSSVAMVLVEKASHKGRFHDSRGSVRSLKQVPT